MPHMDGLEVLEEIGKDEALRQLPVVVSTSFSGEEDEVEHRGHRASDPFAANDRVKATPATARGTLRSAQGGRMLAALGEDRAEG